MAFRRDTDPRSLPSTGELTEIGFSGFDYALRYTTNSHEDYGFNSEDVDVHVNPSNSTDEVEVLFPEEQYDYVVETVNQQLEADREAREHSYR